MCQLAAWPELSYSWIYTNNSLLPLAHLPGTEPGAWLLPLNHKIPDPAPAFLVASRGMPDLCSKRGAYVDAGEDPGRIVKTFGLESQNGVLFLGMVSFPGLPLHTQRLRTRGVGPTATAELSMGRQPRGGPRDSHLSSTTWLLCDLTCSHFLTSLSLHFQACCEGIDSTGECRLK